MLRASRRVLLTVTACALAALSASPNAQQPATSPSLLADRVDVSPDFRDFANNYYVADAAVTFDPAEGITGSHLLVSAKVAGLSEEDFQRLAEDAKKNCPVSQALAGIPITLEASLA